MNVLLLNRMFKRWAVIFFFFFLCFLPFGIASSTAGLKYWTCGVFKNISEGRWEQEWLQEPGLSRAGALREARHQKYSLNNAEAQIGPGRKGGALKSKRELENDKRQSAGATLDETTCGLAAHLHFKFLFSGSDCSDSGLHIPTMTQNYYCSASPDNRLSVTAVMVPAVPSTVNRGALNVTVEIPKLLHTMWAIWDTRPRHEY